MATGFDRFDSGTTVAGVVLNQVGSDRHEQLLRDALGAAGFPVFGAIRRSDEVSAPSRHLGLIPVAERSADATEATARLGALIAASCDLPALLALARSAPDLPGPAWAPPELPHSGERPVVAVAGGAAFTFSYTEHNELLTAAGLDVVPFDPLRDEARPPARPGWSWGAASRKCTPAPCRPTSPSATPSRPPPPAASRSRPSARPLDLARTLDGAPMCAVLPIHATMTARLTLGLPRSHGRDRLGPSRRREVVRAHDDSTAPRPTPRQAPTQPGSSPHPPPKPQPPRKPRPPQKHPSPHQPHQPGRRATSPGTCTCPTCTSTGPGDPQVAARFAAACHAAASQRRLGMTTLVGVGVGPGDPELVTVKAVRALREADVVFVPVMACTGATGPGRAETTIRAHIPGDRIRPVPFALNDTGGVTERRAAAWQAAAARSSPRLRGRRRHGGLRHDRLPEPLLHVQLPGPDRPRPGPRPDHRDRARHHRHAGPRGPARYVLAEGDEPLTLLPLTAGTQAFRDALTRPGTVVGYKLGAAAGPTPAEVVTLLTAAGCLDHAVIGARLGLPGQEIGPAKDLAQLPAVPYLSTLIVPARRTGPGSSLASARQREVPSPPSPSTPPISSVTLTGPEASVAPPVTPASHAPEDQ